MKHLTDLQSLSWNHPLIKHSICYRDLYKPDPKTNRQINLHHCIWSLRVVYKQLHITHPYHNQIYSYWLKTINKLGFLMDTISFCLWIWHAQILLFRLNDEQVIFVYFYITWNTQVYLTCRIVLPYQYRYILFLSVPQNHISVNYLQSQEYGI